MSRFGVGAWGKYPLYSAAKIWYNMGRCWGARLAAKVPRCLAEITPIRPDPGYAGVGNNCDLRPESLEKKIKDIKKVETKR